MLRLNEEESFGVGVSVLGKSGCLRVGLGALADVLRLSSFCIGLGFLIIGVGAGLSTSFIRYSCFFVGTNTVYLLFWSICGLMSSTQARNASGVDFDQRSTLSLAFISVYPLFVDIPDNLGFRLLFGSIFRFLLVLCNILYCKFLFCHFCTPFLFLWEVY